MLVYEDYIAATKVRAAGFRGFEGRCTVLRSLFSMAIMVSGGVIFGRDPSDFGKFSICELPGTTIVAAVLFIIGLALWLRD